MAKKILLLLVVGFAIFFLLSQPVGAADSVRAAAGGFGDAFTQVATFLRELIG